MKQTILRASKILFWSFFTLAAGSAVVLAGVYLYLTPNLPNVDDLYEVKLQIPLRVYTQDGKLIGEFGEKRRTPVKYADLPPQFVNAILSAEDDNFLQHRGVAVRGLIRATTELIMTGEKQTGGSTITMQVARNFYLSFDQTFTRKFTEILLALKIEQNLSKQQIFELYVNKIFWGHRAYGVEAAARVYYGKSISELNLAQFAMIAGLPKAPSKFNPIANPERAKIRRDWILGRMAILGHISNAERDEARAAPITAQLHRNEMDMRAGFVAEMARAEIIKQYGRDAYDRGWHVYTTVDSGKQQAANDAVYKGLLDYDQRHGYRGPEQQYFNNENPEENAVTWEQMLKKARIIHDLHPAIVTAVEEQSLQVLLKDGSQADIAWEDGLSDVQAYQSENYRGPKAKSAAEIASVGDMIRLRPNGMVPAAIDQEATEPNVSEEISSGNIEQPQMRWQFSQLPAAQAALISIDPQNGAIRSLVGGFDFLQSKFNRATQGARQPGSNFKPFIYAAALNEGFTAASLFNDAPVVMADAELENTWRPENASGKFYGPTRLRKALYLSRNLVSVRLLRTITPAKAINYVQNFGFDPAKLPRDLSLSLGSHAVTPQEVVRGFAVFANGGHLVDPYLIQRIEGPNGGIVFEADPATVPCQTCETSALDMEDELEEASNLQDLIAETREQEQNLAPQVIAPQIAHIIDSVLKDVIIRGTGTKAQTLNRRDIAGKTGTTNGPRDAWFSGYTQDLATTVWLGFDRNTELGKREYGGYASLPIWIDYMREALKDLPERPRSTPNGIVSVRIDPASGLLAAPGQTDAIFEVFREQYVPTERAQIEAVDPFAPAPSVEGDTTVEETNSLDTETIDDLF
jgi:penicillin-binding protein 1A